MLRDTPLAIEGQKHLQDLDVNMQYISSEMQNNFDFNSARNSPKQFPASPIAGSARGFRQMPRATLEQTVPPVSTLVLH
jgi:hypothetical protein